MVRRTIAGGGVVLVLILLVLGVRGCLDARQERAFKDYAGEVNELVTSSDQQSEAFFGLLREGGEGSVQVEQQINGFRSEAEQLVDRARGLDPPDELQTANRYFVDALEFRRDGLAEIGDAIPTALGDEGRSEATQAIATQMLQFLASDVIMISRVIPNIRGPLEDKEVLAEVTLPQERDQLSFLPDTDWLDPGTVADRINRIRGGDAVDALLELQRLRAAVDRDPHRDVALLALTLVLDGDLELEVLAGRELHRSARRDRGPRRLHGDAGDARAVQPSGATVSAG